MISAETLSASNSHIASTRDVASVRRLDRVGGVHTSIWLQQSGGWLLAPSAIEPVDPVWEPLVATTGTTLPGATRERLLLLSRLEQDWDSYGALPVSPRAIAASGTLISRVIARAGEGAAPHEIMPIADGGISLEWRYPTIELGINACPEGGWSYLLVERKQQGRHYTEGYGLADDDALALIFRTIDAASA